MFTFCFRSSLKYIGLLVLEYVSILEDGVLEHGAIKDLLEDERGGKISHCPLDGCWVPWVKIRLD